MKHHITQFTNFLILTIFFSGSEEHHHNEHVQELQKRSESFSKKRHPSGSGKRMSFMSNRKKLLAPLKDAEDLSKSVNDRYWGITLPGM